MKSEKEIRARWERLEEIDDDLWDIASQFTPERIRGWTKALEWVLEDGC